VGVDAEFVMSAVQVLDEGVAGDHHLRGVGASCDPGSGARPVP
jgi:hypothetical protein